MTLGTRLYASAETDNVRITLGISDTLAPLDINGVLQEVGTAENRIRTDVARLKFVHDVKLLRAALFALANRQTIQCAVTCINNDATDETDANHLLHGYLAGQGWRPYEPIDGTRPQFEEATGILGGRRQVQLGKQHSGDVVVSLATGQTLVAEARDAYLFDWVEVPGRGKCTPRPDDQWWFVRNYKDTVGYDSNGDKTRDARRNLTVPEVPANLDAMIHRLNTEN